MKLNDNALKRGTPSDWRPLFRALGDLASEQDCQRIDDFSFKYTIHDSHRGCNSWGERLPDNIIAAFRADYLLDVEAVRRCKAFAMVPEITKANFKDTVFRFPCDECYGPPVPPEAHVPLPRTRYEIEDLITDISETERPTSNLRALLEQRGFVRWTVKGHPKYRHPGSPQIPPP